MFCQTFKQFFSSLNLDKNENRRPSEILSETNQTSISSEENRTRNISQLEASPKCPPDYDSSATVSADESQNVADGEGRDPSPRVVHSSSHGPIKMPIGNEPPRKAFQSPLPLSKDMERPSETSIPIVKTLLQDPKIGAAQPDIPSYIQPSIPGKEEPTCVRDLIYQAIEMSLQYPISKPGRNSSPIPSSVSLPLGKDPDVSVVESKKEADGMGTPIPPTAHSGSRHPSRPNSHHMDIPPDCEVQDLSKKAKSRDVSPVKDFAKRERVVTPVRPPSGSNVHYYNQPQPPPAHCNTPFRSSQPPPPALSPHFVAEPHHEAYYPRGGDSRSKSYVTSERPHSQPPHLVAQSSSLTPPSIQSHSKSVVTVKPTVPPPPPLVASKPSQMSPKIPYKERVVSIPPSGSITQGTPVNQQSIPVAPTNLPPARYEGFFRQLPPPQSKDGGSITLGTPVPHDSVKRLPPGRPESYSQLPDGLVRQAVPALYDPSVMEYYRQVTPGNQQYSYPPGYAPYPTNVPPQRPPYANESQLSTKQIMIDFNTSKQMQSRRGGSTPSEKEIKVSPRGSDSSPAPIVPQENHLHAMYPPNYQAGNASHYSNHVPAGYQPVDTRYMHHRSPNAQIDRTRSPSGVESPLSSANYSQMPGKHSPSLVLPSGRQNVIHRSITWGTAKPSVIQAPQSASPRTPDMRNDMRNETVSPANIRKSTSSPRQPQPLLYPSVPPSGHDAFNTLVNAAVAQPSLVVPKDGKGSPSATMHMRQEVKSPRDRPVVEGLEKTLIDMHQRPRSYTESSHNLATHERSRNNETNSEQSQMVNDVRYTSSTPGPYDSSREHHRLSDKQMLINEQSSLRLGNMREPFSREQFERQMRQTTSVNIPRDRSYDKKEERPRSGVPENQPSNYPPLSQQSELDNEASKIFSQSFQKDAPISSASPRGLTAANLIDAIITRQINQNVETQAPKSSSVDLFNQYNASYDGNKTPPKPNAKNTRTEVVTLDDEPESDKTTPTWTERPSSHGRSPPVPPNSSHNSGPGMPAGYPGEKVYTLSEHIAAIISKDYSTSEATQPLFSSSQHSTNTSVSSSSRPPSFSGSGSHTSNKPLEGIASALPPEVVMMNSNVQHGIPDHSPQNCPGNGCSYHTHSWKLRRALQQDREREHRSPGLNESVHKRPSSNQSSDAAPQEERQIIRVAQTSSPSSQTPNRTPPLAPYAVEPISPPSQVNENNENSSRSAQSHNTSGSQLPVWANNPSITGLLTACYINHDFPDGIPPPSIAHYPLPSSNSNNSGSSNRPAHQQQMGLSPLDYVKNRIEEVMRTATDDEPESSETRRPQSAMSHPEEREHQLQHMYRLQQNAEVPSERPCSTGNGPPLLQGQRYSPAVSRYSPVPPRPSSAVERVPSRNSTPGELARQHKRGSEGHLVTTEWRGQSASRTSSRSVSPNIDNLDSVSRKKTRSEGTFIPESTTDRAPVLLPQNSISVHRSGSLSEAPRLSSSNQSAQVLDCQSASKGIVSPRNESYLQPSQTDNDCYKFRVGDSRPESQWGIVNNHRTSDTEPLGRLAEPLNIGAASSTTVETYSPSRSDIPSSKNSDRGDSGTRQSPVTSSGTGSQELNRNSPSASSQGQRSASSTPIGVSASPSSGHYSPFGTSNGSVSSSTNTMYSSAASLPPPSNSHYSTFTGMGTTIAYPFSALSMRSLAVSSTLSSTLVTNSSSSVTSSRISPMPVSNSRNSPSPLSRNNQPPPLLSSQYEPLSDED